MRSDKPLPWMRELVRQNVKNDQHSARRLLLNPPTRNHRPELPESTHPMNNPDQTERDEK